MAACNSNSTRVKCNAPSGDGLKTSTLVNIAKSPDYNRHTYHNAVKGIISEENLSFPDIKIGDRYLYTYKKQMAENNGAVATSLDKYSFNNAFMLGRSVYFLSEVYGIWTGEIVTNEETGKSELGEITRLEDISGSFYTYHKHGKSVTVFGDRVIKFTLGRKGLKIETLAEAKPFSFVNMVQKAGRNYICGTYESGIWFYKSSDNTFIKTDITIGRVTGIVKWEDDYYAAIENGGVWKSSGGRQWEQIDAKNIVKGITGIASTSAGLFVSLYNKGIVKYNPKTKKFDNTNLATKNFSYIKECTWGPNAEDKTVWTSGWGTDLYAWDNYTQKFVSDVKHKDQHWVDCINIVNDNLDIHDTYFMGPTGVLINECGKFVEPEVQFPVEFLSIVDTSDNTKTQISSELTTYLFGKNTGIFGYDRNYYIKDACEIRIFREVPEGAAEDWSQYAYSTEAFEEGDRVVVLDSPKGKSIEYGLRNNYLVPTDFTEDIIEDALSDYDSNLQENIEKSLTEVKEEITALETKHDEDKQRINNRINKVIEITKEVTGSLQQQITSLEEELEKSKTDYSALLEQVNTIRSDFNEFTGKLFSNVWAAVDTEKLKLKK